MTNAGPPDASLNRRVWRLTVPIILSNVTVPLLGAVDTAVVGQLGEPALIGAVAVGAIVFNFIYWGFGFLRMGTTGFSAQALGARDFMALSATLGRAILIGAAIALTLLVLQAPIAWAAFGLFEASAEVEQQARAYYDVRIWGAPATLINYALIGWFIGRQEVTTALVLQLLLNGLNIAFDFLFVMGLGWGVPGVAAATLIGEYSAMAAGLTLAYRRVLASGAIPNWRRITDLTALIALLRVNGDIFVRTLCLIFVFAHFTNAGAGLGDVLLAANAVLLHFQQFQSYALDGFAHAAEALVGERKGRRDRAGFRAAARAATIWAAGVALLLATCFALGGGALIDVMSTSEDVRAAARLFLFWMVLSPILSVWSFMLDGIFIGATESAPLRNAMIVSLAAYLVAEALLLPAFGNHGLWAALMAFMVVRALALLVYYPRLERRIEPAPEEIQR